MVITITKITKNQWKEILSVAKWVVIALACSAGLAYWDRGSKFLQNVAPWLATPAALNLLGVIVKQILSQEQKTAEANIPQVLAQPVEQAKQAIQG